MSNRDNLICKMKWSSSDLEKALIKLHLELCEELNIKPVRHLWFEGDDVSFGMCSRDGKEIIIDHWSCAEYGICPFLVMAHETYHLYQVRKGWLKDDHYRGKPMLYWQSRKPVSQWPWERAARSYEGRVTKARGYRHPRDIKPEVAA